MECMAICYIQFCPIKSMFKTVKDNCGIRLVQLDVICLLTLLILFVFFPIRFDSAVYSCYSAYKYTNLQLIRSCKTFQSIPSIRFTNY